MPCIQCILCSRINMLLIQYEQYGNVPFRIYPHTQHYQLMNESHPFVILSHRQPYWITCSFLKSLSFCPFLRIKRLEAILDFLLGWELNVVMHFSIFRPIYMLMSRVHLHQIGWQTAGRSGDFLLSFSFCVIKGADEQLDMAAQAHPFTSIQLSVFPRAVSQERTAWYGECAAGFNGTGHSFYG